MEDKKVRKWHRKWGQVFILAKKEQKKRTKIERSRGSKKERIGILATDF